MGKKPLEKTVLAEAPSIREGEVFKATPRGLQRLRTQQLRGGGKHHKIDELPYWRISSLSYEEKVLRKGSHLLAMAGIVMALFGLGMPVALSLTTIQSFLATLVSSTELIGIRNALLVPNIAMILAGTFLVGATFPRTRREGWWQLKGLTGNELFGWQVAANARGVKEFINVVKRGIALSELPEEGKR